MCVCVSVCCGIYARFKLCIITLGDIAYMTNEQSLGMRCLARLSQEGKVKLCIQLLCCSGHAKRSYSATALLNSCANISAVNTIN